jgi:hypothetical protein
MFTIEQCEGEAELCFKFFLPLTNHSSRSGDENKIHAPAQKHFPEHQACLDRLAGADIVGNKQIYAW